MTSTSTWWTYVIVSDDDITYVGCTTDIDRRLDEHNGVAAGGAKTTRRGRPWRVGATWGPFSSRSVAQSIEASVKKLRGKARLKFKM